MSWLLPLLAGGALACSLLLWVRLGQLRLQAVEVQQTAEENLRERRDVDARRIELIEKQHIAEQLVDHGAIGVETVHKAIAGLTFGILEAVPGTGQSSRAVRDAHDLVAGETYEAVRKLNRQVGKFLKDALNPDRER